MDLKDQYFMTHFFTFLSSLPFCFSAMSQEEPPAVISPPVSFLFVGNSFTYFNSLPKQIAGIFKDAGVALTTNGVLKGGER